MKESETEVLARKIWDYHHMNHRLEKSDCILVLGSHDLRVAERGAQLFLEGWAPLLAFSGGLGNLTRHIWDEPEAEKFARIAEQMGVPCERILVENKSSNSGENIRFTKALFEERNIQAHKFILVQKPYMERRAYATFRKFWPEKECLATSPQISFENYPCNGISKEDVIHIMTGDLQRIRVYPERGFQIDQEIPDDIWSAYEALVMLGYTRNLIENE
ncbi:MAG TPA: YdcF family protein [Acidobacteriota bacterium]|jgi:uncharacterized SAM-binding protein YcdF (DUF218 family)